MPRYRLSDPAKADIASLLRASERMHGTEARIRYRALLTAAMRRIAAQPQGPSTTDRSDLFTGVRSFHVRNSRAESGEAAVGAAVHVIFYRALEPSLIEIVRVLHERMQPSRHIGEDVKAPKEP